MPNAPARLCNRLGCRGLVRNGICDVCGPRRSPPRTRTTSERGYGYAWQQISKRFLRQHRLCAECQKLGRVTLAQEVHHIVALARGGTNDESNLMALCKQCHAVKTRQGE